MGKYRVWANERMGITIKNSYLFVIGVMITFMITCLVNMTPFHAWDLCGCEPNSSQQMTDKINGYKKRAEHRLAILVPFRDRFEELLIFVPHIQKFLDKQNIDYHIFVLNQVDRYRFNRASLINVGFLETEKVFDYIAMHDVDLLPMNDQLSYAYPSTGPHHISSPDLHPRYHYFTFIGGILLIKREHFTQVNGMSNKYWGWGLEDDEFYIRLKEAGLSVSRPQNISTGTHNTFKHIHDRNHRKRDMTKCYNQREVTRKRDRQTGLNNVSYKILDTIKMTISDSPLTVINISLLCDKSSTPWCECEKLVGSKDQGRSKEKKKTNNSKLATGL